jgi:dienelactone hydrolase
MLRARSGPNGPEVLIVKTLSRLIAALVVCALALSPSIAQAALKTKVIEYKQGDTTLEGYLAWDDSVKGKLPGVVVFHEWWGHGSYERKRAEQLAGLGYIAFAADIYGKGVHATTADAAQKLAGPFYGDRSLLRARAEAALDVLKSQPQTDTSKLGAIGYCFGGTTALELARSGAPLGAVISFHGGLASTTKDASNIKAKLLVLTGGDDQFVGADERKAFEDEMRAAGVNWEMDVYGGAVHAFTNPAADSHGIKNIAYNAQADQRSWQRMQNFFGDTFK